jgi:hypothetical protein
MSRELLVRGTRLILQIFLVLNLLLQTVAADASDDRRNVWVDTDLASGLKFNESSLNALNLKEPLHSFLAANIVSWSQYWDETFGIKGFYPFDLVAVKSVLDPELFNCVETTAILNTSNFFMFRTIKSLQGHSGNRPVVYCDKRV